MTPLEHIAAVGIVFVGSVLQGSIGFGVGLVASPLLVLLDPSLVPGPLLIASVSLTPLLTRREWHAILFTDLTWSLTGRMLGTMAALAALLLISPARIALVFGALILGCVGLSARRWHFRPGRRILIAAGTLSGFMGTTVSVGGPPMALAYQHTGGPRIIGTLAAFQMVGGTVSIIALATVGRFGRHELIQGLLLLPGVVLGFIVSRWTAGRLRGERVRRAVLVVSAVAAVAVMVRYL